MTDQTDAARTTAFYDAIDAFQRTHRLPGLQHAQLRGLLAEHLARVFPATAGVAPATDEVTPSRRAGLRNEIAEALEAADYRMDMRRGDLADAVMPVLYREWPWLRAEAEDTELTAAAPAVDQPPLRTAIAEALAREDAHNWGYDHGFVHVYGGDPETDGFVDAVLAVLPDTSRAAVLREAYEVAFTEGMRLNAMEAQIGVGPYRGALGVAHLLRRMADETQRPEAWDVPDARPGTTDHTLQQQDGAAQQQPDTETLAAALDGLHTLIATSSRDWGEYRVDAWLWAVLCGWDCEQTVHDDTCTHGAMEETAERHGWDTDAVAKARRYRAAVRALTASAVPAAPDTETPQDGAAR